MDIKKYLYGRWYIKAFIIIIPLVLLFFSAAFFYSDDREAYVDNENPVVVSNVDSKTNSDEVKDDVIAEEKKPEEVLIVIDPGHGGEDWGTYYGDIYEKKVNLDVSLRLGKLLQNAGIKVIYTREKDDFVDLRKRSDIANELKAALFISIHHNQMPDNPGYKGTETLYCTSSNTSPDVMNGKKFAQIIQDELVESLKTVDNGIIYRPNLSVLRHTKMPAVIAEIGYISNKTDRANIGLPAFRQKAADALFKAITRVLGEMKAIKNSEGKWMLDHYPY